MLDVLRHRLLEVESGAWSTFAVPGLWIGASSRSVFASPPAYHLHQLQVIEDVVAKGHQHEQRGKPRLTYYAFIRHCTAYDHGQHTDSEGWTTNGSLLKMLSLLPYLHRMGIRTIIVLPIMHRGRVGRKGIDGSPYAIRHPLRLDSDLVEPALGLDADTMFRMLVAAAHALGITVVVEVVLRTASLDSDLVDTNPEWFYWVHENALREGRFAKPQFDSKALALAERLVADGRRDGLPVPDQGYRAQFAGIPRRVLFDAEGWLGIGPNGQRLRIPGAFADWPPDDPQPPWDDVTYLRLYDHPDYNYMAYNTVRCYDAEIDKPVYRITGAWNLVAGVIPHFMRQYGVDGAMIDMGHALPEALQVLVVHEVRKRNATALLYEENFNISTASVDSGYNGVVGYLPFIAHDPAAMHAFVQRVAEGDVPVSFFTTPETHNTPRAASRDGGVVFAQNIWFFMQLLPHGIPLLHAGMELGATVPVNTGLGFTAEQAAAWTSDRLPLFSYATMPWDEAETAMLFTKRLWDLSCKHWYRQVRDDDVVVPITVDDARVVAYLRHGTPATTGVVVVMNYADRSSDVRLTLPEAYRHVVAAVDKAVVGRDTRGCIIRCDAWQCVVVPVWLRRAASA